MTLLVVSIAFIIYRMADGFVVARGRKDYELKSYNKWYYYWLYALAIIILRTFLDFQTSTGIQTFRMTSSPMSPTLQVGDWVVADLNPKQSKKFDYGDIVIFNSPTEAIWVFRVVGMPKDSIEIKEGKIYINGELNQISETNESKIDDMEAIEYTEILQNKKAIKTFRIKTNPFPDSRTFNKYLIPENEYFLLGDNRDNSYDSRFIGTIKEKDILGKVIYSYWGNTSDRINIDFRLE